MNTLELLGTLLDLRSLRHELVASDAEAAFAMAAGWPQLALDFELFWGSGSGLSQGILSLDARSLTPLFGGGRRAEAVNIAKTLREERRAVFSSAFLTAVATVK